MTRLTRRGTLAALAGGASATACGAPARAPRYDGVVSFKHGVASGDPGLDRVVIWTRVTPEGGGDVPVRWVVAHDRGLKNVVQTGEITTTAARDYTVKIDVQGLSPNQRLFYGFLCGDKRSPVGRTRTLPRGGVNELKLGVVSCSNHPFGFFNAYEALSKMDDIDVVLHLGDYIYEYGLNGYGGDVALTLGRMPRPEVEIVTLGDYRLRHAQYKEEPELQAAHAMAPWIVVWDDHEVANDSWQGGAEDHNPENNEGNWDDRKQAALQAYYEWLPIRDPEAGKPFEAINRSFQFGDLATIIMLETRLLARMQQLDYAKDLGPATMAWDMTDPTAPKPVPPGAPRPAAVRDVPMAIETATGRPIGDWARVRTIDPRNPPSGVMFMPDIEGFKRGKLADPQRALLGAAQEEWLKAQLAASRGAGTVWQVLGNQTVMARVTAPDFSALPAPLVAKLEALQPGIGRFLQLTRFKVPMNLDAWDGYPAQRNRLYGMLTAADANAIVVTGDSHDAWANELTSEDGKTRVGVEFGATSVTSPGTGDYVKDIGVDVGAAFVAANTDVKWHDPSHRGFTVLTLRKGEAVADFYAVSTIISKDYTTSKVASFRVKPEKAAGVSALEKIGG
ncbi:MAG: alkaline phosphatase D [Alphaproteobacteria bacterium]|nr:MAG: alkaline phosphatase D [Caulobacteraceae bacterium]TPW05000.1 MAG: alkaline phosphatase D [Alphaproteobacteria bacterium]